jgi:uroporphyrinogen III methyltransferase/synthase
LPDTLRNESAKEVVVAPAYRTIKPKRAEVERIRELIAVGTIDLVTFTSSSTVTNFCELVGEAARRVKAAAIGPITAETAKQLGFDVVVSPREYTISALAEAIREYCARHPKS